MGCKTQWAIDGLEAYWEIYSAIVHDCYATALLVNWLSISCILWMRGCVLPLILYSPVSMLRPLRMLKADEALDPMVSTRSKPGWATSPEAESGRAFSSVDVITPGRLVKGLRMGIVKSSLSLLGR